jgi:hypothetical protein
MPMASNAEGARRQRPSSRALILLEKVVATGWFEPSALARALAVSDSTLERYLSDTLPIPLDRQLCLALFVIECLPALARSGHQLRRQVAAAIAFQEGATVRHMQPPPRTAW